MPLFTPLERTHAATRLLALEYLVWMVGSRPHARYNPRAAADVVLVDILGMREGFFAGMERFLIDAFADARRRPTMERRIGKLVMEYPVR
jgi:hypothetical protein